MNTIKLGRTQKMMLYSNNYICRGGNWHPPAIPQYKPYITHRRLKYTTPGMSFMHEVAPEYLVNLHSKEYPTTWHAVGRIFGSFLLATPLILFFMWINKRMGAHLHPTVTNCPDHAHKLPGLIRYIRSSNFNKADDFLGRNNGEFYKQYFQEDLTITNMYLERAKKNGI